MSESLWGSIEAAMSRSSSFVLMASPGAAHSPWVAREVQYWRTRREASSFHIVLTDGEIAWDREHGDFDWNRTTALPPDLTGWFADEPFWLDVRRPPGVSTHADQRNDRLRDAARTIAAPLYGLDKDQLDGEDEREARRARRTLRLGVVALSILTVIALLAAGVAYRQYVATRNEERLAIARLLLPQADALLSTDPQKALQINEAAERIHPDQETRAGLLRNLTKSRYSGTLTGHTDTVYALAYAADGRTLATSSRDNHVNLWDVADGRLPTQPVGQVTGGSEYGPLSLSFAPDGRMLAGAGFGEVSLWDTSDPGHPRPEGTLVTGRTDDPASVLFTPGGVLVARVDGQVRLYADVAGSLQALGDPLSSTEFVNTVSIDARGTTLVGSGATSASIWDISDPRRPRRLGQFSVDAAPRASALSPDGRLFVTSAGWGGTTIGMWDLADPESPHRLDSVLTGHALRVNAIAFSADGRIVATGGDDGTTRLWDVGEPASARQIGEPLVAPQGFVNDLALDPTGRSLATAGDNGTVVLWSTGPRIRPDANAEERLPLTSAYVWATARRPDGKLLAAAGEDDTVTVTDLDDRQHHRAGTPLAGSGPVTSLAFCGNGDVIAIGRPTGSFTLWDFTRAPQSAVTSPAGDGPVHVACSADGTTLATTDASRLVRIWDTSQPDDPRAISTPPSTPPPTPPPNAADALDVRDMAFSATGRALAITDDQGTTSLWDVTDRTNPVRFGPSSMDQPLDAVAGAFSPDGNLLAVIDLSSSTQLWDLTDPRHPHRIGQELDSGDVRPEHLAFAPDGSTLSAVGKGGTVIWDMTNPGTPTPLAMIEKSGPDLVAASYARGNDSILVVDYGGATQRIELAELNDFRQDVLGAACDVTQRGLSPEDWLQYVPVLEYEESCA